MNVFIAMLRGINVSGQKLIKMESLRKSMETIGFTDVVTYIQSGNIVFRSKEKDSEMVANLIADTIKIEYGFDVPAIVLTLTKLQEIVHNNPFPIEVVESPAAVYISYLFSEPEKVDMATIEINKQVDEQFLLIGAAFYLYCPSGYGNTKISNTLLEKKLKVSATTRNWKTSLKLVELAHELQQKYS